MVGRSVGRSAERWWVGRPRSAERRSARLGSARRGAARRGSARLGSAQLGWARLGSARLGLARLGLARLGSAQDGSAGLGSGRLGSARICSTRHCERGKSHRTYGELDCFFLSKTFHNPSFLVVFIDLGVSKNDFWGSETFGALKAEKRIWQASFRFPSQNEEEGS